MAQHPFCNSRCEDCGHPISAQSARAFDAALADHVAAVHRPTIDAPFTLTPAQIAAAIKQLTRP